jgi:hypothetical protein
MDPDTANMFESLGKVFNLINSLITEENGHIVIRDFYEISPDVLIDNLLPVG